MVASEEEAAELDVDVVVVGSGAAGLSAALCASVQGARVVVLEKAPLVGGTSAMSGACSWIPNHHHMHELNVTDSREEALSYIRAVAPDGWHNEEEPLWQAFVQYAPEMLKFLERHSPLLFAPCRDPDPYEDAPGAKAYGRNVTPRPIKLSTLGPWRDRLRQSTMVHLFNYEEVVDTNFYAHPVRGMLRFGPVALYRRLTGRRTKGGALIAGLLRGCLDRGCEVRLEARARRLVVREGRIAGIEVTHQGRDLTINAAKGVVLASGGFEWNAELMAKYLPGPLVWRGSPDTNTGDGHLMALEVGARLDRMDQSLIIGTTPVSYEGRDQGCPAGDHWLPHSMIVNQRGERFVNEKQMNIGLAFEDRDPRTGEPVNLPAWRIYDRSFAKKYGHALPRKKPDGKVLFQADSLRELAARIGVDADGLVQTARRFSEFARNGVDEDFGRGATRWDRVRGGDPDNKPNPTLGAIETAPFYAMPFHASYLGTKGGPRTNARAQVLREDGTVIAGLYAAGNVMANPFGSKAVGAGTTIGPCLTWGYIAGLNAMEEAGFTA